MNFHSIYTGESLVTTLHNTSFHLGDCMDGAKYYRIAKPEIYFIALFSLSVNLYVLNGLLNCVEEYAESFKHGISPIDYTYCLISSNTSISWCHLV